MKIVILDGYTENPGDLTHQRDEYNFISNAAFAAVAGSDTSTAPSTGYTDVAASAWYADAVSTVTELGLMNGTTATAFSPDAATTRGMLVTILARYDGTDTSAGSVWYEAGADWAVENGVSDGTNMNGALTREQLVTMLWRYAGSPEADDLSGYPDSASVSSWAADAMAWAVENGLITGTGTGALSPQGSASRAQLATILVRAGALLSAQQA